MGTLLMKHSRHNSFVINIFAKDEAVIRIWFYVKYCLSCLLPKNQTNWIVVYWVGVGGVLILSTKSTPNASPDRSYCCEYQPVWPACGGTIQTGATSWRTHTVLTVRSYFMTNTYCANSWRPIQTGATSWRTHTVLTAGDQYRQELLHDEHILC